MEKREMAESYEQIYFVIVVAYRVGVGQNSIKSTWDKSMKLWRVFSTPGQNTPRVVVEYYVSPQLISPINLSASHGATFVDRSLAMKPVNFSS